MDAPADNPASTPTISPSSPPPPPISVSVMILAAKRTHRPDPLRSFQMYSGGWNLTNMNYLASAGFTGIPGFAIGVAWVLAGFITVIGLVCIFCCCKEHLRYEKDYGKAGYYIGLLLLMLFTAINISGCGALFAGQEALHTELLSTLDYMMSQVATAMNNTLNAAPPADAPQVSQTVAAIANATNSTSTLTHHILDQVHIGLIIVCSTMLGLTLVGLLFIAFGLRPVVYCMVWIGWHLVFATWVLFGGFLFIYTIFNDTCVAMQEWVANPQSGTSFDLIMQCNQKSATSSHFRSTNFHPVPDEILDKDVADSVEDFLIQIGVDLEPYKDILGHERSSNERLAQQNPSSSPSSSADPNNCQQMLTIFAPIIQNIETKHCPSLCKYSMWVWVGLATVSTGSTLLIISWLLFIRRANMRYRKGLKDFEVNAKISHHGSDKKSDVQELPILVQELPILQKIQEEPYLVPVPVQNLPNYTSKDFEGLESSTSTWTRPGSSHGEPMQVPMTVNVGQNLRKRRDEDVKYAL